MRNHLGKIVDKVQGYTIIDCKKCEFKHVFPFPPEEKLQKLYREDFYSLEKPDYFKHMQKDLEWWMLTYSNYYNLFEKYTRGRRLLEIGSGPGYFLKCGERIGWEVLGFEPSKQAYRYSINKGVKVINDFFTAEKAGTYDKFDVVHLSFVLEHLTDPLALLKNARRMLNKEGLISIISPNDYNPLQNILRRNLDFDPWWIVPEQHINYFDFDSIQKLLKRLKFEIVELQGTFPMEFFLLGGENYVGNNKVGRKSHARRKKFEMAMYKFDRESLNNIYRSLSKFNIGREFLVIGKLIE